MLAVVPTDYDNRRDIDLLLVAASGNALLFRNFRDGTFRDVAGDVGLTSTETATMAAIGDVNKDGYPDFFFARRGGVGVMASSDGLGRFTTAPAPSETADARAAQFIDYDSDGLIDLFLLTARGPRLLRNLGREWNDVTAKAIQPAMSTSLADADVARDGRFGWRRPRRHRRARASGIVVWRNQSTPDVRTLTVRLTSRVSNRSAVGAKIEMRAGSLRQQHETYAASPAPAPSDIRFGLGDRDGADVVRVLWPSGILQAETGGATSAEALKGVLKLEELDRKPSSCPYLYTWNGERFEFITDFLGGGEMGYWLAPGARNTPDPDEYVRIAPNRLRARDGRYELRITNELEESLFLDRVQLVTVDHPLGIDVHPNEGLVAELRPFKLYYDPAAAAAFSRDRSDGSRRARQDQLGRSSVSGWIRPRTGSRLRRRTHPDLEAAAARARRTTAAADDWVDRLCLLWRQRCGAPGGPATPPAVARSQGTRWTLVRRHRRYRHAGRAAADGRGRSERRDSFDRARGPDQDHDADLLGPGPRRYLRR